LKKRKMANFKSKNLCDESSKIKNLRWQFSCIFRCLRHGILRFFFRRRFHGDIPWLKSPVLQISKKVEKWAFSCGKIRPLEMNFFAFFPTHILDLSERYVLDPQTLIEDSKQGFPAMITERSKMIIIIAIEQMDYRISATISQLSNRYDLNNCIEKTLKFFFLTWWHFICLK